MVGLPWGQLNGSSKYRKSSISFSISNTFKTSFALTAALHASDAILLNLTSVVFPEPKFLKLLIIDKNNSFAFNFPRKYGTSLILTEYHQIPLL